MLVVEISDINATSENQCHKTHTGDERESMNYIKHNLKTERVWSKTDCLDSLPTHCSNVLRATLLCLPCPHNLNLFHTSMHVYNILHLSCTVSESCVVSVWVCFFFAGVHTNQRAGPWCFPAPKASPAHPVTLWLFQQPFLNTEQPLSKKGMVLWRGEKLQEHAPCACTEPSWTQWVSSTVGFLSAFSSPSLTDVRLNQGRTSLSMGTFCQMVPFFWSLCIQQKPS